MALALLIAILARRRAPVWSIGVVLVAPVVILLADESFRIYSVHGLMHSSIVYPSFAVSGGCTTEQSSQVSPSRS